MTWVISGSYIAFLQACRVAWGSGNVVPASRRNLLSME